MINEFYHYRPSQISFVIFGILLAGTFFYQIGKYCFDNDDIEKAYRIIETYINFEIKNGL